MQNDGILNSKSALNGRKRVSPFSHSEAPKAHKEHRAEIERGLDRSGRHGSLKESTSPKIELEVFFGKRKKSRVCGFLCVAACYFRTRRFFASSAAASAVSNALTSTRGLP